MMLKRVCIILALFAVLAIPPAVFAHSQALSTTIFFACENPSTGEVDANSITQKDTLNCNDGTHAVFSSTVQWSVTGPQGVKGDQGTPGQDGTNGSNVLTSSDVPTGACTSNDTDIDLSNGEVYSCVSSAWTDTSHTVKGDTGVQGPTGPAGPQGSKGDPGLPFSHAACIETGLSGVQQQENLLFCLSGIEADGGLVYHAAINAAAVHVLVGTPIAAMASVDWGTQSITYVEFTSGLHAEYHADNKVRFYNTANQQIF